MRYGGSVVIDMAGHTDVRLRGFRSARSFWFTLASIAALILASHHTMPLGRGVLPHQPLVEALRTLSSFALAGCCVGLARASMRIRIYIPLIGVLCGAYALAVSVTLSGTVTGHNTAQSIVGALLAADGAMLGAWLTKALLR